MGGIVEEYSTEKIQLVVDILRVLTQWSTLVLSLIFRNQFNNGILPQLLGGFLILCGFTLWILSKIALGKEFTTSLSPKGFVTKGIYSKMRHPMYSGGLLFFIGIGMLFQSIVGLILTGILVFPLLVYSAIEEEKQMVKKFGEKYIEYKKKTAF